MVSNLGYPKLKLSNFTVKHHDCDVIIPLYDTEYMFLHLMPTFHENLTSRCYKKNTTNRYN